MKERGCTLDLVPENVMGRVAHIDDDERIQNRLEKLGFIIGTRITVKRSGLEGGKIKLTFNDIMLTISRTVAKKITITTEKVCENITLDKAEVDADVKIAAIDTGWGVTHQLMQAGCRVGDLIHIMKNNTSGGPLVIRYKENPITISRGAARKIVVIPAKNRKTG
jgi:Fe2+ transport system protein FeoA